MQGAASQANKVYFCGYILKTGYTKQKTSLLNKSAGSFERQLS